MELVSRQVKGTSTPTPTPTHTAPRRRTSTTSEKEKTRARPSADKSSITTRRRSNDGEEQRKIN